MKYIYSALLLLLLQGCGSSEDSSARAQQAVVVIEMEIDTNYTVYKGDKVVKTSSDAQISILKNAQDDTSTVALIQGSANIIRN